MNKSYVVISKLTSSSLKKYHNLIGIMGQNLQILFSLTLIGGGCSYQCRQDVLSIEDDTSFLFLDLQLIAPPPFKNIYVCVEK